MDRNKLKRGESFVGQYDLWWETLFGEGGEHHGMVTLTDRRLILEWKKTFMFKPSREFSAFYDMNEAVGVRVVRIDRKGNEEGECRCTVTFRGGSIDFTTGTDSDEFSEFRHFVNAINHEITGSEEDIVGSQKTILSDFANTLGAVTKEFGQAFGIGSAAPAAKASPKATRISVACTGCGAPLSGIKGKTVTCEYCCVSRQL